MDAYDVRPAKSPSPVTEAIVVVLSVAAVVAVYRVARSYRLWAVGNSPFAGPRARTAAFKTSYGRRREDLGEVAGAIGDIQRAMEKARAGS